MSTQPVEPAPRQPVAPGPTYTRPAAVPPYSPRAGMGSLAIRVVLTALGAAGMIIGAFMAWFHSFVGTEVGMRMLIGARPTGGARFITTVGAIAILLGLLAIVGLAPRSGWLTRLAGALAIVELILFVIQVYRAPGNETIADLGLGAWLVFAGGVVALIGGFFGTRYRVVYTPGPAAVETTEP